MNKQLHGFTFTKHITYYHKKINDNMNMESTITGSINALINDEL